MLHSPAGCIPQHHAVLEKIEKLTHDFPSDPLSGWTGGWRGQRGAKVSKKEKRKILRMRKKETAESESICGNSFAIQKLKDVCWPGSLK